MKSFGRLWDWWGDFFCFWMTYGTLRLTKKAFWTESSCFWGAAQANLRSNHVALGRLEQTTSRPTLQNQELFAGKKRNSHWRRTSRFDPKYQKFWKDLPRWGGHRFGTFLGFYHFLHRNTTIKTLKHASTIFPGLFAFSHLFGPFLGFHVSPPPFGS